MIKTSSTASPTIIKILDHSTDQFMRLGIKSVSMDDLASHIGISKKTLYHHIENKMDLVRQSIARHTQLEQNLFEEISRSAVDAIDEMAQISEHTVIHFRQIRPTLIHDLQKYYRQIWESVISKHSEFMRTCIIHNIQRGQSEGYYRPDLDPDIVSKLYISASFSLVDENQFSLIQYEREHLIQQHILYHLYGIFSDKGKAHFQTFELFKSKK